MASNKTIAAYETALALLMRSHVEAMNSLDKRASKPTLDDGQILKEYQRLLGLLEDGREAAENAKAIPLNKQAAA